jgi:hypothetical protein
MKTDTTTLQKNIRSQCLPNTNLIWTALAIFCLVLIVCSGVVEALPSISTSFDISATPLAQMLAVIPVIGAPGPQRGSRTIKEWCEYRHLSLGAFYHMKKKGVAPVVSQPPGAPPRITNEADAAWVLFCENLPPAPAAEAAARNAKRLAASTSGGVKAAKSPKHISQQRLAARRQRESA